MMPRFSRGHTVRILVSLIFAFCVVAPGPASAAEAYQIHFEMFDEPGRKTICTYRSPAGEYEAVEFEGRHFCPRVVDSLPPASLAQAENKPKG